MSKRPGREPDSHTEPAFRQTVRQLETPLADFTGRRNAALDHENRRIRAKLEELRAEVRQLETALREGLTSTVRADAPASELAQRLRERELTSAIVSTPEGRLIGVASLKDLAQSSS